MTSQQALAKQVPITPEQPISPITEAAGKTQEVLGNSPILPMLMGGMARAAVPIPGISSATGAMVGERMKQSLNEGGPMAALKMAIPSLEQNQAVTGEVAKSGLVAGATDLAATTGVNAIKGALNFAKNAAGAGSLNPFKVVGYARNQALDAAGNLDTSKVISAGEKYVENNPLAKEVWDTFKPVTGKSMSAGDLTYKMSKVWDVAYDKSGDVKNQAAAKLFNELYQAGKSVIKEQAPEVAKNNALFKILYDAPKTAQKATWLALKTTAIGKMLGL
jgi:hypothetical protein